jgi:hypothetical protein
VGTRWLGAIRFKLAGMAWNGLSLPHDIYLADSIPPLGVATDVSQADNRPLISGIQDANAQIVTPGGKR